MGDGGDDDALCVNIICDREREIGSRDDIDR